MALIICIHKCRLCVCAKSLQSCQLFATLWTVAYQAPLSVGFSRQEYWSGLPCPLPGDLPNPEYETSPLASHALYIYMCMYLYVTYMAIQGDLKVWWGSEEDSWWGDLVVRKNLVQPRESIPERPRGKPEGSPWSRWGNSTVWSQKGVYGAEERVEITGKPHWTVGNVKTHAKLEKEPANSTEMGTEQGHDCARTQGTRPTGC